MRCMLVTELTTRCSGLVWWYAINRLGYASALPELPPANIGSLHIAARTIDGRSKMQFRPAKTQMEQVPPEPPEPQAIQN